ncbi:MAG TPA: hypothetical protein VJM12_21010 [Pyrinomonadaceae bacterium]|nr:hypothetical protein [Pyrinomonadaceae bacterium]
MNTETHPRVLTKDCPICSQTLPLTEFGICRARKDGRNLYCKSCIRKKVTESRQALRAYKSARKRSLTMPMIDGTEVSALDRESFSNGHLTRLPSKLSPIEKVREAIRRNARTQREIAQETKLGKDEIGDALANLLLWTREIRTEVVDNTRMYFINEFSDLSISQTEAIPPSFPRRKPDVPSSFSALQGLMPGRKPEGEPDKIGGWVAA